MNKEQLDNIKSFKEGYVKAMNIFYNYLFGTKDIKNAKIPKRYSLRKVSTALGGILNDSAQITEKLIYSEYNLTNKKVIKGSISYICRKANSIFKELGELENSLKVTVPKDIYGEDKKIRDAYIKSKHNIEEIIELANKSFLYGLKYTLDKKILRLMGLYAKVNEAFFDIDNLDNKN